MRIEVCGVGQMGLPIAERLIENGHSVYVRDDGRGIPAKVRLRSLGAEKVEDSAGIDLLLLCLPDGAAALGVLACRSELPPNVVDLSSLSPKEARSAARLALSKASTYVDSPISGSSTQARAGMLTAFAGVTPGESGLKLLQELGIFNSIVPSGPVGSGMALKLVNQAIHIANLCALVEGAELARTLGVESSVVLEGLSLASANSVMLERFGSAVFNNVPRKQFKATLARKDLENVLREYSETKTDRYRLAIVETSALMLDSAIRTVGNAADLSEARNIKGPPHD